MDIIIYMQGFNVGEKTFFPKELAPYDGTHISLYIFKALFSFQNLDSKYQKSSLQQ